MKREQGQAPYRSVPYAGTPAAAGVRRATAGGGAWRAAGEDELPPKRRKLTKAGGRDTIALPVNGGKRLFLRTEVIAMTVLEVLALLNLLCVIVFGILGYIKK